MKSSMERLKERAIEQGWDEAKACEIACKYIDSILPYGEAFEEFMNEVVWEEKHMTEADWRNAVANGDTLLGYDDWMNYMTEKYYMTEKAG